MSFKDPVKIRPPKLCRICGKPYTDPTRYCKGCLKFLEKVKSAG